MQTYRIPIKKFGQETPDTISIVFDVPQDLHSTFDFVAGQYITIVETVNGEELRRSYSICSAPDEKELVIAVKRVKDGRMSNYLNDHIASLDALTITPPEGKFCIHPDPALKREHYFITTGSGITPILSMIKDILENESRSRCYLYYGSRNQENILFGEELESLQARYKGQLDIIHTLSQPSKDKAKGLLGVLGVKKTTWQGENGRIDLAKLINFMELYPSKTSHSHYYLCGAGELIQLCVGYLGEKNIDENHIHTEYFTIPDTDYTSSDKVQTAELIATIGEEVHTVKVPEDKTILQALIDKNIDAPYSCSSGACSSCIAKITAGSAEMEVRLALDDDEIAEGYILACQAHPTSDKIEIIFNDLEE